jgi:hypothetical protein
MYEVQIQIIKTHLLEGFLASWYHLVLSVIRAP